MKIRLMGTAAECVRLAFLLRFGPPEFEVVEISPPYPDRGASELVRVCVEVRFPEGLAPVDRTFYSLTSPDGSPLLVDASGTEVEA
jgi:hypothetical protein